jgi:methyl-accepting chemotaxis protein
MAEGDHETRLTRLEQIVGILAEDQHSLTKIVADLARETRIGFDRVAAQFEQIGKRMDENSEHMRQTDERMRQTDERMRRTDERIDKLVVAMGEFMRRN